MLIEGAAFQNTSSQKRVRFLVSFWVVHMADAVIAVEWASLRTSLGRKIVSNMREEILMVLRVLCSYELR